MIVKTAAIALRSVPTANTSRVVTWLTPEHGRVATMIKGAVRPKSFFLGQFDLFYTCELLYYQRDDRELFFARECYPNKPRPALRHRWKACAAASYMADLAARITPSHAPQTFLFHWLDRALDELDRHDTAPGELFWLELRLLTHLGLTPRLQWCTGCQAPLRPESGSISFSSTRGGLLCGRCARNDPNPARPIPPDALAILRNWQKAPDMATARRIKCAPRQLAFMEDLLGQFLRYHLDLPLASRDLAFAVMKR